MIILIAFQMILIRVPGAVDNDYDKDDNDNDQMPYDNDNDTATGEMKYDRNMTNKLKDVGTKDTVPYKREDNSMTKVKWSIETSDVGNDFMREYDNMRKSMEDRQIKIDNVLIMYLIMIESTREYLSQCATD